MNKIKNFFKKVWKEIKNFFSIDNINNDEKIESVENTGCSCSPNCTCDKENCTCNSNTSTLEENTEYEQLTIFSENEELENIEDDNEVYLNRYTDETVTRDILITVLRENGITGIIKLKKAALLAKFHELNLEFPEVK